MTVLASRVNICEVCVEGCGEVGGDGKGRRRRQGERIDGLRATRLALTYLVHRMRVCRLLFPEGHLAR